MTTADKNGSKAKRPRRAPVALAPSGRKRKEGKGSLAGRSAHFRKRHGGAKA